MPLYDLAETDKAYIAGLIDGEGCITVVQRAPRPECGEVSKRYVSSVTVQMCDEKLIRWLPEITGVDKVYVHPPRKVQHSTAWAWRLGVQEGVELLQALLPYLRLKKQQAELFIEMARIRSVSRSSYQNEPRRQNEIAREFRVLNRRGVA